MIRKLCMLGFFLAQTAAVAGPKPAPAIPSTLRDMIKAPLQPLSALPYESHAYRAGENVELVQSESLNWLNRNCGPVKATADRL
jgi:hypothetical protein